MTTVIDSPYLVPFDNTFSIADRATIAEKPLSKTEYKKSLSKSVKGIAEQQDILYADGKYSVLLVFQAMDAAGKDSTIRKVLTGVNPAGCQVSSFKQPSKEELAHDYLWRINKALPKRGYIGVFNRSHYEETLVVQVHPEYLGGQNLPEQAELPELWSQRYESIRNFEQHLANNGTVILKFWLNVSQQEQHRRFKRRLQRPEKNWKYSAGDVKESALWDKYMQAYQDSLNATSRDYAPWYAIPADDKPTMRVIVAEIVEQRLNSLGLSYPTVELDIETELAKLS